MLLRFSFAILVACCTVFHVSADEIVAPTDDQELISVASLTAELKQFQQSREHAVRILGEDISDLELYEALEELGHPAADSGFPTTALFEVYITKSTLTSELGSGMDMVYPGGKNELLKIISDDDTKLTELQDDVLVVDDELTVVLGDGRFAIPLVENEQRGDAQFSRLRKLMDDVARHRSHKMLSISSRPSEIGRSTLKPLIDGLRATLLTQAQRRDDDDEFSDATRSLQQHSLVGLLDSFFNDCEEFEYSLNYDDADNTTDLQIRMVAKKKSETNRFIGQFASVRNRTLSWLHPDSAAFVSFSVPLPDLVTDALPKIMSEGFLAVESELNLTDHLIDPAVVEQFAGKKQFDAVLQAIPTDERTAHILVLPLESANSLESTWLKLVSASGDIGVQLNVGEVGGWPLHAFYEDNDFWAQLTSSPDAAFYCVMTDQCVAFLAGTADDISLFEQIVTRDFEPSERNNRFRQAAFAASIPTTFLNSLSLLELPTSIRHRITENGLSAIDDDITVTLHAEPQTLVLNARFDADAFVSAMTAYTYSIEVLADILY